MRPPLPISPTWPRLAAGELTTRASAWTGCPTAPSIWFESVDRLAPPRYPARVRRRRLSPRRYLGLLPDHRAGACHGGQGTCHAWGRAGGPRSTRRAAKRSARAGPEMPVWSVHGAAMRPSRAAGTSPARPSPS